MTGDRTYVIISRGPTYSELQFNCDGTVTLLEITFRLTVTLEYLMLWLARYLLLYPPPGIRRPRLKPGNAFFDRDLLLWGSVAAIRGVRPGEGDAPLVEIWVTEYEGRSYTKMRLNDPRLATWFRELLGVMHPTWLWGKDHGLPALPAGPALVVRIRMQLAAVAKRLASKENPIGQNSSSKDDGPVKGPNADPASTVQASLPPAVPDSFDDGNANDGRLPASPTTQATTPPNSEPTVRPSRPRPGAKGLTPEDVDELVRQWRGRPDKMSVDEFCETIAHVSKTTFYKYMPESEL